MKKIVSILILALALVGCNKGQSYFELQYDEMKVMNCYREFYKDKNGIKYYTEIDAPIYIKFSDADWISLDEALDQNLITMEEVMKNNKYKNRFTKCEIDDTGYPCDMGCGMLNSFILQFEDYMNCYHQVYVKQDGTKYYTSAGTIKIHFPGMDWMLLQEAIDKELITMEEVINKEEDRFKKCNLGDTGYPCDAGC